MFPESQWRVNDVLDNYEQDEDSQRLYRAYLDDLSSADSLRGLLGALYRLGSANSDTTEQDIEESVEQEPDDGNNVVEDSEQKKVDTSEVKLQKLLANVLKNKRGNYTHGKESINDSCTLYEG